MTRAERREELAGRFVAAWVVQFERMWSRTNPDHESARKLLVRDAFAWAEVVMAETDRREAE